MDRDGIKSVLPQECLPAVRGREYWLSLKEQHDSGEGVVFIIMQTMDAKLSGMAVELLPGYLKKKYLQKAVIITDQNAVAKQVKSIEGNCAVFLVKTDRDHMDDLLSYYRLVQFHSDIIVISTEEPYGNSHIIGKEGITLRDYVKNALYV